MGYLHRIFGLKIFSQIRQNRIWHWIRPLMEAVQGEVFQEPDVRRNTRTIETFRGNALGGEVGL
jgi:hypothetical protein